MTSQKKVLSSSNLEADNLI